MKLSPRVCRTWVARALLGATWGLLLPGARADELGDAEQALAGQHYTEARALAEQALRKAGPLADARPAVGAVVKAWRVIGASSCFLKDRDGALKAAGRLSGREDVQLVRFACERNGISLTTEEIEVAGSPAAAQVQAAQSAYTAARYADAKKLALEATRADPKLGPAWRIVGTAACWTRDKAGAQAACDHLQAVDQELIRATCARTLGVQLKNPRILR